MAKKQQTRLRPFPRSRAWTIFQPQNDQRSCRASVPRTRGRKWLFENLSSLSAIAIGFTSAICPVGRTWSFDSDARLFSFTVATGIGTPVAPLRGCRSPALISGCRSLRVTARDDRNSRLLAEDDWGVLTIWECQLNDMAALAAAIRRFLDAEC